MSKDPPAFAELTRGDLGILASEIGLEMALDAGAGGSFSDEATTTVCLADEDTVVPDDLEARGKGTLALFSLPLDVTGRWIGDSRSRSRWV